MLAAVVEEFSRTVSFRAETDAGLEHATCPA